MYFKFNHKRNNGTSVEEHGPERCTQDCKEFLFLKPILGKVPNMKMPGYIGLGEVFEASLDVLRETDHLWFLRDCSLSLITDKAIHGIADRISRWKPRYENQLLCNDLFPTCTISRGMICWGETMSKQLLDKNGTSYTGCGPCFVMHVESRTATILVVSMRGYVEGSEANHSFRCATVGFQERFSKDSRS